MSKSFGIDIVLLMFLLGGMVGHELYLDDSSQGITRNIYNFTESSSLFWNSSKYVPELMGVTSISSMNGSVRINNVMYKLIDTFGYVSFETMKFSVEYGYTHGSSEFSSMLNWFMYYLYAYLAYLLFFPVVIICYLGYLLINWIKKRRSEKNVDEED